MWGKSGSTILYSPPGSFPGRYHNGYDTSSTWSLLGSLPVCLPSQGGFLAKTASPPPRLACPPKTEVGGTARWLDAHGPLLALLAPPAQECKGHLQISPLKGVHLKGGG